MFAPEAACDAETHEQHSRHDHGDTHTLGPREIRKSGEHATRGGRSPGGVRQGEASEVRAGNEQERVRHIRSCVGREPAEMRVTGRKDGCEPRAPSPHEMQGQEVYAACHQDAGDEGRQLCREYPLPGYGPDPGDDERVQRMLVVRQRLAKLARPDVLGRRHEPNRVLRDATSSRQGAKPQTRRKAQKPQQNPKRPHKLHEPAPLN